MDSGSGSEDMEYGVMEDRSFLLNVHPQVLQEQKWLLSEEM